jgi:hypothetical protein
MVTRKYFSLELICCFTVILLFNACDIFNNDTYSNSCWCDKKVHLGIGESCKCGADKGACKCTEQIAYLDGIPIRKDGNYETPLMYYAVTDMNVAVDKIITAYMWLNTDEMSVFKNKITEIHIILGDDTYTTLKGTIFIVGAAASDFDIYLGIQNWVLSS